MLDFLLFDDAKLGCNHRLSKKKHFTRLAKQKATFSHLRTLCKFILYFRQEKETPVFSSHFKNLSR